MKCNCGSIGEHKVFETFSYWYCSSCKTEIATDRNNNVTAGRALEALQNLDTEEVQKKFIEAMKKKIDITVRKMALSLSKTDFTINWIYINNKHDLKRCIPTDTGWYKIREHDGIGLVHEYYKFWDGSCWSDDLPIGWTVI